jgi:hypothetical protein
MTGTLKGFVVLGAVALVWGSAMMVWPVQLGRLYGIANRDRAKKALLIAGMMLAAFGLVLASFALVYSTTAPLDLNAGATR